jgi:hypothetical protein
MKSALVYMPNGKDPVTNDLEPVAGKTTKLEFELGDKTGTATLFPPYYTIHKVNSFSKKEKSLHKLYEDSFLVVIYLTRKA